MEEINLGDLLSYFKKKMMLIVIIIMMSVISMIVYVYQFKVPMYTASTTMILANDESSDTITSNDISLNNSLITTYSEIAKSKKVINTVIKELSLVETYNEIVDAISVTNVTGTSIIKISITHEDSTVSAKIANELATIFAQEVTEIYNIDNLSIIDIAEVTKNPSNDNGALQIMLSWFVGMFLSFGFVFLLYYLDKKVKTKDEVERITNFTILTVIPLNTEKN